MYLVVFARQAAKGATKLKASGLDVKAKALIEVVKQDPFAVPPRYEALVGNLSGMYSRRLSIQHRFVYEVIDGEVIDDGIVYRGTVKVLSMWSHYENL